MTARALLNVAHSMLVEANGPEQVDDWLDPSDHDEDLRSPLAIAANRRASILAGGEVV